MIMTIDETPILEHIDESIEKLLKSEEAEMKSLGARLLQNAMTDSPEDFDLVLRKYIQYPFRFEYRPGISTNDLMVKVIDMRNESYGTTGTSGYSGVFGSAGTNGYSTTYTYNTTGTYNIPLGYNTSTTTFVGYNTLTGIPSYYTIGSDEDTPIKQKKTFLQWLKTKILSRKGASRKG